MYNFLRVEVVDLNFCVHMFFLYFLFLFLFFLFLFVEFFDLELDFDLLELFESTEHCEVESKSLRLL
jgi:hypothetical protein